MLDLADSHGKINVGRTDRSLNELSCKNENGFPGVMDSSLWDFARGSKQQTEGLNLPRLSPKHFPSKLQKWQDRMCSEL